MTRIGIATIRELCDAAIKEEMYPHLDEVSVDKLLDNVPHIPEDCVELQFVPKTNNLDLWANVGSPWQVWVDASKKPVFFSEKKNPDGEIDNNRLLLVRSNIRHEPVELKIERDLRNDHAVYLGDDGHGKPLVCFHIENVRGYRETVFFHGEARLFIDKIILPVWRCGDWILYQRASERGRTPMLVCYKLGALGDSAETCGFLPEQARIFDLKRRLNGYHVVYEKNGEIFYENLSSDMHEVRLSGPSVVCHGAWIGVETVHILHQYTVEGGLVLDEYNFNGDHILEKRMTVDQIKLPAIKGTFQFSVVGKEKKPVVSYCATRHYRKMAHWVVGAEEEKGYWHYGPGFEGVSAVFEEDGGLYYWGRAGWHLFKMKIV